MRRRFKILMCAVAWLTTFACARADTEKLRGTVVDSSGAPIAGVTVVARSQGQILRATTDAGGEFSFRELAPPASIRIFKTGFAESIQEWHGEASLRVALKLARVDQQIVVTATRTDAALGEVASAVTQISGTALANSAPTMIDDALRQVPGFSLFRRSGSRSANPTSQGVSLRALGASGASRALVLMDEVPLNDPFGGWVYWDRVPPAGIDSVEVLRGGGSALYGSGALAGLVNVVSVQPITTAATLDVSAGNETTDSADALLTTSVGRWGIMTAVSALQTDGYVPVRSSIRGRADTDANVRFGTGRVKVERRFDVGSAFVAGNLFNESRQNGTVLQTNDTRFGDAEAGVDARVFGGSVALRGYGSGQRFNQSFSSISADRNTESLVRTQAVPAQQLGGSAQWSRSVTPKSAIVIGGDAHRVAGNSDELLWTAGTATSRVIAGGRQIVAGGFLEAVAQLGVRTHVTAVLRGDTWRNYDALSTTIRLATGTPSQQRFAERSASAISPSVGATLRIAGSVSLTASGYGSFRAPTLNELYRAFRLGNVQTLANDTLDAERLWGGETGIVAGSDRLFVRGVFFADALHDAIGNRTLTVTPSLITRQRQNIGTLASRGFDVEARASFSHGTWARIAYEFADSTVRHSLDVSLQGLRTPQVPRHSSSAEIGYSRGRFGGSFAGRYVSLQFDDDQNVFSLSPFFAADTMVRYRISRGVEAFAAAENLFDRTYTIGRSPTETIGPPRLVRAGLRLQWRRAGG